ncbi:hypothetical protein CPB84DRAFT_1383515 [Gymnopilus junonius]|uniref:Uncharacterized protein n=1 Tax=Gymnopilus junonius TaxID=109634 RepID=A0A9P5NH30_GYMJU|nr:hypothetical protein CPB84DRAFT_1383515 [Gymnopilus junonius]
MTKPQEDMALYTPVVFPEDSNAAAFESSLPSLSSISGFSPNLTYLEDLQRKHHALAQIVREEPPSPPRLPSSDDSEDDDGHGYEEAAFLAAREERIAVLKQRVREAFIEADGNPADGKWALVARLLKMESTSGQYGRWSGTRTDRRPPQPLEGDGIGWINAETEVEWNEWEKKYLEERRLKDKVENWQRRVLPPSKGPSLAIEGHLVGSVHVDVGVPVPHEPGTSNQVEQPQASKAKVTLKASAGAGSLAAVSSLSDPLRDAAPFGFGVVKRASQNTNSTGGKPSKPTGNANHNKQPSADRSNGPPRGDIQPKQSSSKNKDKNKEMEVQRIGDFPHASSADHFNGPPGGDVQPEPSSSKNKDKNKESEVQRIDDLVDANSPSSLHSPLLRY